MESRICELTVNLGLATALVSVPAASSAASWAYAVLARSAHNAVPKYFIVEDL